MRPNELYSTVRVFDTETDAWLRMPAAKLCPGDRSMHTSFSYRGELYVIENSELWKLNPQTFSWTKLEPIVPSFCRKSIDFVDRNILFSRLKLD